MSRIMANKESIFYNNHSVLAQISQSTTSATGWRPQRGWHVSPANLKGNLQFLLVVDKSETNKYPSLHHLQQEMYTKAYNL